MKQRPLSPHLQVYNLFFKISSLTSITHRLTGIAAVMGGSLILVWWLMAIAHGPKAYQNFIHLITTPFGYFVIGGLSWCFWYQVFSGVRHLFWDAGVGFKLQVSKVTGVITIALSILATLLTWLFVCGVL